MISGDIPAYMRTGRGSMPGPVTGGYHSFCVTVDGTNLADDTILFAIKMPFDFRLEAFSWHLPAAATATAVFALAQSATSAIGGTALLSATIDLEVATEGLATGSGTTPTLTTTSANRIISKGDFIVAEFDGNSAGDIVRGTFVLTGFPMTHCNPNASDD